MKRFISLFILILLISCSEENTTEPTPKDLNYHVYYSISQQNGWRPEHSGLYRFEYPDFVEIEEINNSSIIHTTRVAKNGIFAFVVDSPDMSLNIRYPDGNIQKVTLPEFVDKSVELLISPKPEISLDGNKLAYLIKVTPNNSQNETDIEYYLVVVNIPDLETSFYNLMDFDYKKIPNLSVKIVEPVGDNLLINYNGSEIQFTTKLYDLIDNNISFKGFAVIELKDSKLTSYADIQSSQIELIAKNYEENKTIVKIDDKYFVYNSDNNLENISIPKNSLYSYRQFSEKSNLVVMWDIDGIGIYNASDFTKVRTIITWQTLKESFNDLSTNPSPNIAISPDGEVIGFAINPIGDKQSYHFFLIKSDGQELKKILPFTPINCPVISYGYEIE